MNVGIFEVYQVREEIYFFLHELMCDSTEIYYVWEEKETVVPEKTV